MDGASSTLSIAAATAPRSVVGGTISDEVPAKITSPMLNPFGTMPRNSFAAVCAATMRVGFTSSASIDRDTSMVTMTVARSRGTSV